MKLNLRGLLLTGALACMCATFLFAEEKRKNWPPTEKVSGRLIIPITQTRPLTAMQGTGKTKCGKWNFLPRWPGDDHGVTMYYIWYGKWAGNTAMNILTDFAQSIGGSPYFNINTTYTNGSNTHVMNSVIFGGSTTVAYPQGTSLSDAAIQTIVSDAITTVPFLRI